MKYAKLYTSLLMVLIMGGCTESFDLINSNENAPTENNPATLLPSVIFEPINAHMILQTWLTDQIMHYYVRRNDNQIDAYDFATGQGLFDEVWRSNYSAIWNINDMNAEAEEQGLSAYVAAYLCEQEAALLRAHRVRRVRVRLEETETCYAEAEQTVAPEARANGEAKVAAKARA